MRKRAWVGGLFLSIGLFLFAAAAQALILDLLPVEKILGDSTFILTAKVETLDADNSTMMLKADETIKGKSPFSKLPVVLKGDADAAKGKHTPLFLKRLAVKMLLLLFVNQRDKEYIALGYTNGTWFQLIGAKPADSDTVRWSFTHLEPHLRRTFKGTTDELRQAVVDTLAGKRKPPEPNPKEPPGFGPEATQEKPKTGARLQIHGGPVFGVIALPTLAGPLAVLALLFPSLFGGWKRWLAVLSVLCTTSTVYFVFWWFAGSLGNTLWASPLVQWLTQTAVIFLGCAYAWRRQLHLTQTQQNATAPGRSEAVMLSVFSLIGATVLFVGWRFFGVHLLTQAWMLMLVPFVGAVLTTLYVVRVMMRASPQPPLSREVVMLTVMTLVAIGLAATQQARTIVVGGAAEVADKSLDNWTVTQGQLKWKWDLGERGLIASTPLVAGEYTYVAIMHEGAFGTNEGAVHCLNTETGKHVWTTHKKIKMRPISLSSPCLAKGRLYIGEGFHDNSDCKLYCLDAKSGALIWQFETGSHVESSATVVDGRAYFGAGDDGIFCVDAVSGKEIWHFPGLHVDSTPLVSEGRVYAGSGVGDIVKEPAIACVDAAKGGRIWQHPLKLPAWGGAVRAGKLIYFGIGNGRLNASDETNPQGAVLAVKADTGEEVWRFKARDGVLCRPTVDDSRVYFGSRDGYVYCVDRLAGQLFWKRELGSPVVTELVLALDHKTDAPSSVYALAESGQVFCLGPYSGKVCWSADMMNLSSAPPQLWSSPALTVTADNQSQVRRIYFGVNRGLSGSLPMVCCYEDRQGPLAVEEGIEPQGNGDTEKTRK